MLFWLRDAPIMKIRARQMAQVGKALYALIALVLVAWQGRAQATEARLAAVSGDPPDPGLGPPVSAWYLSLKTSKGYCGLVPAAASGGYGYAIVCNNKAPQYDTQFTLLLPPLPESVPATQLKGGVRPQEEEEGRRGGGGGLGGRLGLRGVARLLAKKGFWGEVLDRKGTLRIAGSFQDAGPEDSTDSLTAESATAAAAGAATDTDPEAKAGAGAADEAASPRRLLDPSAPVAIASGRPVRLLVRSTGLCNTPPLPPPPPSAPSPQPPPSQAAASASPLSPASSLSSSRAGQSSSRVSNENLPRDIYDTGDGVGGDALPGVAAAAGDVSAGGDGGVSRQRSEGGGWSEMVQGGVVPVAKWVSQLAEAATRATAAAAAAAVRLALSRGVGSGGGGVGDLPPRAVTCSLAQPSQLTFRIYKPSMKDGESVELAKEWVYLMEGDKFCTLADVAGLSAVISCHLDAPGWSGYKFQLQEMSYPRSQLKSLMTGGPCAVRVPSLPGPHDVECEWGRRQAEAKAAAAVAAESDQEAVSTLDHTLDKETKEVRRRVLEQVEEQKELEEERVPELELMLQTPGSALVGGVVLALSTFSPGLTGTERQRCCAQTSSPHILVCEPPGTGAVANECWFQLYDVKIGSSSSSSSSSSSDSGSGSSVNSNGDSGGSGSGKDSTSNSGGSIKGGSSTTDKSSSGGGSSSSTRRLQAGTAAAADATGRGGRSSTLRTEVWRTFLHALQTELSPASLDPDLPTAAAAGEEQPTDQPRDLEVMRDAGPWNLAASPHPQHPFNNDDQQGGEGEELKTPELLGGGGPLGDGKLVMLYSKAFGRYCSASLDGTLLCVSAQASNASRNLFTLRMPPLPSAAAPQQQEGRLRSGVTTQHERGPQR